MRPAFSMITAIFVLVLMATVAVMTLNFAGKSVKATTSAYQNAQAELYAKSYTEYAIMAVTAHDRNATANCVQTINGTIGTPTNGNGFSIRTEISYIGIPSEVNMCPATRRLANNVQTNSTPLSIIIDVYVRYRDPDEPESGWHIYHRRTIQKI